MTARANTGRAVTGRDGPLPDLHGVIARFEDADALVRGYDAVRGRGFTRIDAYTPFPLDELRDRMPVARWPIPLLALAGGVGLGLVALGLQVWANLDYPLNVGGRPVLSWTAFSLPALQFAALGAVVAAVLGMLLLNGLPRLHHPVFAAPEFGAATGDGWFLLIERGDPLFTQTRATDTLRAAGAVWVAPVPA